MDVQTRHYNQEVLEIEVKILLGANGKSYMPHHLAQWMTLSDLEWHFHNVNIIRIMRYLCSH